MLILSAALIFVPLMYVNIAARDQSSMLSGRWSEAALRETNGQDLMEVDMGIHNDKVVGVSETIDLDTENSMNDQPENIDIDKKSPSQSHEELKTMASQSSVSFSTTSGAPSANLQPMLQAAELFDESIREGNELLGGGEMDEEGNQAELFDKSLRTGNDLTGGGEIDEEGNQYCFKDCGCCRSVRSEWIKFKTEVKGKYIITS